MSNKAVMIHGVNKSDNTTHLLACDSTGRLKVATTIKRIKAAFVRPANTTDYTVGDVVDAGSGTGLAIAGAATVNGGSGYITGLMLMTNQAANVAEFRIHFYSKASSVNALDNQQILTGDHDAYHGYIDLPAMAATGGQNWAMSIDMASRIPFVCEANDTGLWAVIETKTAFTPASGQAFKLYTFIDQN